MERLCQELGLENFNPRSPYGERLQSNDRHRFSWGFQSTLPLRGATSKCSDKSKKTYISIHAPLTGSDEFFRVPISSFCISIHAPLTGSDQALL